MKESKNIEPPRWAQRFLEWYCRPELLEDLQGDLNEFFERNITLKGIRKAKWIYVFDVLKFFRLYTIRKPEFINFLINFIMIGSYIKTSEHSLVRNKLFSAINIVEIAVSMAVGLLMIGTLLDMYAYDKFHEKHNRIYRVLSRYGYLGSKEDQYNVLKKGLGFGEARWVTGIFGQSCISSVAGNHLLSFVKQDFFILDIFKGLLRQAFFYGRLC